MQREALYRAIHNLQHQLPGWLGVVSGANVTPEIGMDKGYTGGFIIDFIDETARNAYLENGQHQQIGTEIVNSAIGGVEGIMVFDFLINEK